MDALERFCKFIDFTDTCWLWTSSKSGGYGVFWGGDKTWAAHRYAWVLSGQTLIEGLEICHSCRNRHCVNPDHLRQDTRSANMFDKIADGTNNKGEKHNLAKLTDKTVLEIRASDKTQKELSVIYNVSYRQINYIIHRRTWKHI